MLPSIAVGEAVALSATRTKLHRGDVVVFTWPGGGKSYVKRIVGLEGDVVATQTSVLFVNGSAVARCPVGPWSFELADHTAHRGDLYVEELDGSRWLIVHDSAGLFAPPEGPWTVPAGEVFVLGDNRENSFDTRMWFKKTGGALPIGWIIGVRRAERPHLPRGAEGRRAAFMNCLGAE